MKIIVGLGNPGKEYEKTRHNIGWRAVTAAAEEAGAASFAAKKEFKAEIAEAKIGREKVLFVHPLTFMNASGEALIALRNFYKCELADLLVVHDEMDFPLGEMQFLAKGGAAGHNGVASIQERLGTGEIPRLRLGIGRPIAPIKKEDYVLQPFAKEETKSADKIITSATKAIHDWITSGLDRAANTWNGVKGG